MIRKFILLSCVGISFTLYADEFISRKNDARVDLANNGLKKALEIKVPDKNRIISLLKSGKYEIVEKEYSDLLQKYRDDINYERPLIKAYSIFHPKNNINLGLFEVWVKKRHSYIAYAARGIFKVNLGIDARGYAYINRTPPKNIAIMKLLFQDAVADLQMAIKLEPKIIPAYIRLIVIAMNTKPGFTCKEILDRAIKADKRSYYIRVQYMASLMPKWGGSYMEMKDYANRSLKYVDINPRIWTLQGDHYAEMANIYSLDREDCRSAIKYYTLSLRYGDRVSWLAGRAECYRKIGNYGAALSDYNRALFYDKNNTGVLRMMERLAI